ncbi:endonuclease/exonuclease/phosphatase family protein [Aeromonas australiensis]|uniref:endonuclease/exonuclease/phosphatase family protein n=1 Tax=Aeromonas australiensis TaxID=1114880 RepID=UPI001F34213C|nr:endonuclease/exonuclease/phosphatase family protein [Aeromonas australiensis]MCF3098365.1 endonuclease/exonuclease/phosphatase family protein [Aeromonas australiensis]
MKKINKTLLAAAISLGILAGCNSDNDSKAADPMVRFATFNLSFDRTAAGMLTGELALTRTEQDALLARLAEGSLSGATETKAKNVQQIRNVAEIIQRTRPDVFLLNEFDNDGKGESTADLKAFNDNYLAHAQHAEVTAISYPVLQNLATNTGLMSGYDLNLDGKVNSGPDDAWGFGNYHGQYAMAVMSKYPIDTQQIRTFQKFKWKDMPGEQNPIIDDCNNPKVKIPASRQCGDAWYDDAAWQQFPLSSKNHADVPVRVKTDKGEEVIHFLISHPTPPIFGNAARHNVKHNRAEVAFWNDYVKGLGYMTDDKGTKGGLAKNAKFVIAGDLNADPLTGDGDLTAIQALLDNALMNQDITNGTQIPVSEGGPECLSKGTDCKRNLNRPSPERITSSSGLQLDHLIPSANLNAVKSGVFWPASFEAGYHLVYDAKLGIAKGVSSDHRLVWVDLKLD